MTIEVLDPTYEGDTSSFKYATGLKNLKGSTIGIISNGKKGTFHFFNAMEDLLTKKYKAGEVIIVVKNNYSAPAEEEIMKEVKKWDAAIAGVGDWGSCSSCSLHDSINSDLLGVPSFGIMTSKFVSAAELMSRALGAKNYPFVSVNHPISSATKDELKIQAVYALQEGINFLLKSVRRTEM